MNFQKNKTKEIIKKIKGSKKYKAVYLKTIERIAKDTTEKYGEKRAEKETRNILHQIWGAYWATRPNFKKILNDFKKNTDPKNIENVKENILKILTFHSSTRERISNTHEFYKKIFSITEIPLTIIDHACGLNPLTFFWMNLPPKAVYFAYDIDEEQNAFLRQIFEFLGIKNVYIKEKDIFSDNLEEKSADVVFMLKFLPILDQQKKGFTDEIIKNINCKHLIVSFPIKSLSGGEKGMEKFYTEKFIKLTENSDFEIKKMRFKEEIVFILKKD